LAATMGATEFLLLPEQPAQGNTGIDTDAATALVQRFIKTFTDTV
jgi:hypothetical protein